LRPPASPLGLPDGRWRNPLRSVPSCVCSCQPHYLYPCTLLSRYSNPDGLLTPPIPQATITELIRIDREVEPLIVTLAIYIPVDYVLLSYPIIDYYTDRRQRRLLCPVVWFCVLWSRDLGYNEHMAEDLSEDRTLPPPPLPFRCLQPTFMPLPMRPVRFASFLSCCSQGMPENQIASHTINMQKSMDVMARVGE
jgi:hypothetical protein